MKRKYGERKQFNARKHESVGFSQKELFSEFFCTFGFKVVLIFNEKSCKCHTNCKSENPLIPMQNSRQFQEQSMEYVVFIFTWPLITKQYNNKISQSDSF